MNILHDRDQGETMPGDMKGHRLGPSVGGGQVNMGPERKSGPAQWAKIGLRTDAGKLGDLYCGELKEHWSSASPSNCCSLSPNCCPMSHREHEPQRLGSHPTVRPLSAVCVPGLISFTALLIRHLTWGIIKPGIWKSLGKPE